MNRSPSEHVTRIVAAVVVGAGGGFVCGFVIGAVGGMMTTPTGHDGELVAQMAQLAVWGAWFGAVTGAIVVPMAYVLLLHRTGFSVAVVPAFIGTLGGGMLAMVMAPSYVIAFGVVGFFASLYITWWLVSAGVKADG